MKSRVRLIQLLLLLVSSNAFAQTAVELQIYDYAQLKKAELEAFVARTQEILSSAGVSVQVTVCSRTNPELCPVNTAFPKTLILRIAGGSAPKMRDVRRPTLGQSFAERDGGTYAVVFLEQVQQQAAEADIPAVMVLAYTAAHEVGHLLLGQEHSPRGLMKANWDERDFQAMNQNWLHFSKGELRELAARYGTARTYALAQERTLPEGLQH